MILEVMYEAQSYFFDFSPDATLLNLCGQICNTIPWVTSEELQTMFPEIFLSTTTTRLVDTSLEENSILQIVTFR